MNTLPSALHGQRLAVVDVEGNGQQPPEIIEIAILPVDDQPPTEHTMQSWLIQPAKEITSLVTRKVHGITNEDVAHCPPWRGVAPEIDDALAGRVLIAHSATVEHRVLGAHFPDWNPPLVLDTARLAKHVWPGIGKYGLDALIEHASLDTSGISDQRRHRARFDTWCAWQLFHTLVAESELGWDALVRAAALPAFVPPEDTGGGLW
ncbi:exonuclease domain-containing protein [Amycolatopsis sp. NPDC059657]|uniref:3'-5' exonuclease n=1 Tax=Amycolatopsis sp. NPDC059657 TaxID=3346899 RepID=UPI00366FD8DB